MDKIQGELDERIERLLSGLYALEPALATEAALVISTLQREIAKQDEQIQKNDDRITALEVWKETVLDNLYGLAALAEEKMRGAQPIEPAPEKRRERRGQR